MVVLLGLRVVTWERQLTRNIQDLALLWVVVLVVLPVVPAPT